MSNNAENGNSGQESAGLANGTVTWLEIPTADVARVAAFYNAVLGWTCLQPTEAEGKPSPHDSKITIHMFRHGSLHGAFLRVQSASYIADNTKSIGVVATFSVEDVAETLAKVTESGGRIHIPRTEIGGGMGFFAQFVDTEGNVQGLWSMK